MEIIKSELKAVAQIVENAQDRAQVELIDLELTLIGGGCGDPIFI